MIMKRKNLGAFWQVGRRKLVTSSHRGRRRSSMASPSLFTKSLRHTKKANRWCLEKLGMFFNKAIDWMIAAIKRGLNLVISAAKKAYDWSDEFRKKHPTLFKIIIVAIIVAISVAVIYFIFEMVQRLLEDSNIQKQGVSAVPLCGQAAAAAVA